MYVSVRHHGEPVADLAAGEGKPGVAATEQDIGELRCAVKPLTTLCLARAVEAGQLGIDDPLARWAPADASPRIRGLTLRQLLTHTAGLPNVTGPEVYPATFDEYVARLLATQFPAAAWHAEPIYNYAKSWHLLAWVVQRVYGAPIQQVINEIVTGPLGLATPSLLDPAMASRPYHKRSARHRYSPIRDTDAATFAVRPNPAYGGFASTRDLARLYEHLLQCATDGGLVQTATMRRFLRPEARVRFRAGGYAVPVGLGIFLGGSAAGFGSDWSPDSFGHMGSIWAHYSTVALAEPASRTVVAIRLSSVGLANNGVLTALGRAVRTDLELPTAKLGDVIVGSSR